MRLVYEWQDLRLPSVRAWVIAQIDVPTVFDAMCVNRPRPFVEGRSSISTDHNLGVWGLATLTIVERFRADVILSGAREVLKAEFAELAAKVQFHVPDEKEKRHGQAMAAASLPNISRKS